MNVSSGEQPGLFSAGDFVLFDSSGFAAVYPRSRTFAPAPADPYGKLKMVSGNARASRVIRDARITLDTIGTERTIDSVRAVHYRLTLDLDLGVGLADRPSITPQIVHERHVTDFWFGSGDAIPQISMFRDPLREDALGPHAPPALRARLDSTVRALPAGHALLMKAQSTLIETGHTIAVSTVDTVEIQHVHPQAIDVTELVVPAGFARRNLPGYGALYSSAVNDSLGAAWLRPPPAQPIPRPPR
jgi:hypothetical protein